MALIKCPECGKEISDKAECCPNCGCPSTEWIKESLQSKTEDKTEIIIKNFGQKHTRDAIKCLCDSQGYKWKDAREIVLNYWKTHIICPKCGGGNITINVSQENRIFQSTSEIRKKSLPTRIGNKAGRGFMIAMTGGLWALTPKKSNYVEYESTNSISSTQKICICQTCGYSWKIK